MPFDDKKKIERLKEKEADLVYRGNKAVDEGRERKANRLLGRAARVENRIITEEEKGKIPMNNSAIDLFNKKSYAYNAMEDQMRGPDFDHLSENEKKLISVPVRRTIKGRKIN
jgi:hypothetical protein